MNANEFLNKALSSGQAPADFEQQYEYFRKYQNVVLNTLKEFHRVCEKSNINYHVTYGSLLGLIRDGAQIPWDYDIDVFVPVSQKAELMEALKRDLSDEYLLMCPEFDPNCRHYILRVCPKQYDSAAVHLDVFYYCGAPEDANKRKAFCRSLRRCSQIRFSKKVDIESESVGNNKKAFRLTIAKLGAFFFSGKANDEKYSQLIGKYPIDKSKYVVSADFFADLYTIPTEMLTETMLYDSECGCFRIPKDYDGFLKMVYSDYMQYPSVKNGINQVLNSNRRFRYFE